MKQTELRECPFCNKQAVFIGVHDDEGNYKGRIGCEYENDAWSGLCYALHHEGWGDCVLCTDGEEQAMGGVLFDTIDEATEEWNGGQTEIERLEAEIERLNYILQCYALEYGTAADKERFLKPVRAEAIKEFAERLKEELTTGMAVMRVSALDIIDNLVKEFTEGE